jgi:hypothetical protein
LDPQRRRSEPVPRGWSAIVAGIENGWLLAIADTVARGTVDRLRMSAGPDRTVASN